MKIFSALFFVFLFMMFTIAGCSDGNDVDACCMTNDDCSDGNICVDCLCMEECECASDADCGPGYHCTKCECISDDACTDDDDCKENQTCLLGNCYDSCACTSDQDCPENHSCENCKCIESCDCKSDDDCPYHGFCIECSCHDCREDSDCPADYYCFEGDCKHIGDIECNEDTDCPDGYLCIENECRNSADIECMVDSDCPSYQMCVENLCEPLCTTDEDCADCHICTAFGCTFVGCEEYLCSNDTTGMQIVVTSSTHLFVEGEDLLLSAYILNADGQKVVLETNTNNFSWSVSGSDSVTITPSSDSDSAILSGKPACSDVTLTVSICDGDNKIETSIDFKCIPKASDARVVVFDTVSALPIAGAKVFLNNVASKTTNSITTDANGIAEFTGLDCTSVACDLHVFSENHTYLSAFGLQTNDILIPVAPNIDTTVAGGAKGSQNHGDIPDDLRGDVFLGFTSFALPGNFCDMHLNSLLGTMFETTIMIGSITDETALLPGGLEAILNPDSSSQYLKQYFHASNIRGSNTLWGLGGFTNLTDILAFVGPAINDGDIDTTAMAAAISPIISNFYHGIMTNVEFEMNKKIKDIDDINGNNDTNELVPDFDKFTELDDSFILSQAQTQSVLIEYPALPKIGEQCLFNSSISITGVMQPFEGFIPLGISINTDENAEEISDCILDDSESSFAPQHSGLYGYTYYTISIATNLTPLQEETTISDFVDSLSVVIARSETIPTEVTLPPYLPPMSNSTYDLTTHTLTATDVSGADLHRAIFSVSDENSQNEWQIYWKDGNGFTFDFASLGKTEDRTANFADTAKVQAISLDDVDYDKLFSFNASNLHNMNEFIESFSTTPISETAPALIK